MPMSTGMKWLTGCLIAFLLTVVTVIAFAVLGLFKLKSMADTAYSSKPAYKQYKPSAVEISNIQLKTKKVEKDVQEGKEVLLSFTENELNTLISEHNQSDNNFLVSIVDELIKVEASLYNADADKYLNVTGKLSVQTIDGDIHVYIEGGEIAGINVLENMKDENLAEEFLQDNPDVKLDFLEAYVEDSKLWIRAKPKE